MMTHVANNVSTFLSVSFAGNRWARSENDKDIVIITDVNGYIAGEQSVIMKAYTDNNEYYNYDSNSYYVFDNFFGEEAYFATAYFVDTEIICDGGRSEEQFLEQGTGDRLSFQSGPTASDLDMIPLTQEGADSEVRIWHMLQTILFWFIYDKYIYRASGSSTCALPTWACTISTFLLRLAMTLTATTSTRSRSFMTTVCLTDLSFSTLELLRETGTSGIGA
jgi:hypothetical protein